MLTNLKTFWHHYVQQTMGLFEVITGILEYIDSQTINAVGNFFGDKWGPVVSKTLQVSAGVVIAFRGYQARRQKPGAS